MKRAKQKKNRWAIKSGNGHNNPWICPKKWGRLWWEQFMENVSFESGVEQRRSDA